MLWLECRKLTPLKGQTAPATLARRTFQLFLSTNGRLIPPRRHRD